MSQSFRRGRTVRAMAAIAAFSTAVAIAAVAPAQAVPSVPSGPPFVTYVDSTGGGAQLSYTGLDGVGSALLTPANVGTKYYSVSANGATVVTYAETATSSALVVTNGGVSKVLNTYSDAQPAINADGSTVWFLVHGDLYKYAVVSGVITRISSGHEFNPWTAAVGSHSYAYRLAISPDETKAAVLLDSYPNTPTLGQNGVDRSQIKIFTIAPFNKTAIYVGTNYAGTGVAQPQLYPNNFVFTDNNTFVSSLCPNNQCATWTTSALDLSASPKTSAPLTRLDNLRDVRLSDGIWYAWQDTKVGGNVTTSTYLTTTDGTFGTDLTASGATWTAGWAKSGQIVTSTQPGALAPLAVKMGVSAKLTLSAVKVNNGGRVHYDSVGTYPSPLTGEALQTVADKVYVGRLQYSFNGTTWFNSIATVAGGGLTPKTYRNTWLRWYYPGDVLTKPAFSSRTLVRVTPTVTVKVTKSGASRIVSGTTTRIAGTAVLWRYYSKAWHQKYTGRILSTGAYSFGKRSLVKGSYKVTTVADVNWNAGSKAFSIL